MQTDKTNIQGLIDAEAIKLRAAYGNNKARAGEDIVAPCIERNFFSTDVYSVAGSLFNIFFAGQIFRRNYNDGFHFYCFRYLFNQEYRSQDAK